MLKRNLTALNQHAGVIRKCNVSVFFDSRGSRHSSLAKRWQVRARGIQPMTAPVNLISIGTLNRTVYQT